METILKQALQHPDEFEVVHSPYCGWMLRSTHQVAKVCVSARVAAMVIRAQRLVISNADVYDGFYGDNE